MGNTKYRLAHPERVRESSRKHYLAHREIVLERSLKWSIANPERRRKNESRWRGENLDKVAGYARKWRLRHRDAVHEYSRNRWRRTSGNQLELRHRREQSTRNSLYTMFLSGITKTTKGEIICPKLLQRMAKENPKRLELLIAQEGLKLTRRLVRNPEALQSLKLELETFLT